MSAFIWTGSLECPLMRGISWLEHVKVENCCMKKKKGAKNVPVKNGLSFHTTYRIDRMIMSINTCTFSSV